MDNALQTFYCKSCGAKLVAHSLVNLKCSYCGSSLIINEKFDVDFVPDTIITFRNYNKSVISSLQTYISTFEKMDFNKNQYTINSISPVYVPCTYYTYGVDTYRKAQILTRR